MRFKPVILLLILCSNACVFSYNQLRITDRVYAPLSGAGESAHWRRSYRVKYLAPSYGSVSAVVIDKANQLMQQGQYREAVAILSQVTAQSTDAGRIFNNLGVGYEVLGEREKALAFYTAACRLSPKNPYYRNNLNSL